MPNLLTGLVVGPASLSIRADQEKLALLPGVPGRLLVVASLASSVPLAFAPVRPHPGPRPGRVAAVVAGAWPPRPRVLP